MLMATSEEGIPSEGYQVHIKMKVDWTGLRCLETIAEQYGYAVKNEAGKGLVVIYSPKETEKQTRANIAKSSLAAGLM
jgi:hypothetical protein